MEERWYRSTYDLCIRWKLVASFTLRPTLNTKLGGPQGGLEVVVGEKSEYICTCVQSVAKGMAHRQSLEYHPFVRALRAQTLTSSL
jgi:hypothetical protein